MNILSTTARDHTSTSADFHFQFHVAFPSFFFLRGVGVGGGIFCSPNKVKCFISRLERNEAWFICTPLLVYVRLVGGGGAVVVFLFICIVLLQSNLSSHPRPDLRWDHKLISPDGSDFLISLNVPPSPTPPPHTTTTTAIIIWTAHLMLLKLKKYQQKQLYPTHQSRLGFITTWQSSV